jgi:Domain of unknown function (DUF6268)
MALSFPSPNSLRTGFAPGRMSLASACVVLCLTASLARAQSPYPATDMPTATWGGYDVPEPVPYQPTLQAASGAQPAQWIAPTAAGPGGAPIPAQWQTYPSTDPMAGQLIQAQSAGPGGSAADPYYGEGSPQSDQDSTLPPGTRDGVFQKVDFTAAYLPRLASDSLGMDDLELDAVFGLPFLTRESPLVITPFYNLHYLDGPNSPDVPPRVNDAAIELRHFRHLGDNWLVNLEITLGEYADDHSFDAADAFRLTGSGAVVYEWSPVWKWVLGAAYVNRLETRILPIAGLMYAPNDDIDFRLVFPAPKMAWRLPSTIVPGRDERWFYIAGEFGGGIWAVERTNGDTDQLDITDWRIYIGLERRIIGGLTRRVELGYVFSRKLEYASMPGQMSLDDTLMLRAGVTY